MTYSYRLSSSAASDLEREIAYSANHWGKRHAKSYRQGLLIVIRRLVANPLLYPERTAIGDGYRLVRYKGNYIIYTINALEKYIEIIGFPSIHRDLPTHAP